MSVVTDQYHNNICFSCVSGTMRREGARGPDAVGSPCLADQPPAKVARILADQPPADLVPRPPADQPPSRRPAKRVFSEGLSPETKLPEEALSSGRISTRTASAEYAAASATAGAPAPASPPCSRIDARVSASVSAHRLRAQTAEAGCAPEESATSAPRPMATDDKYDRQLRLWGGHGQRALSQAHVVALGSDVTACESLKNLVLPGVGRVTVVDCALVTAADLGRNFFLSGPEDLGLPRCEAVARRLQELNPDSTVAAVHLEKGRCVSDGGRLAAVGGGVCSAGNDSSDSSDLLLDFVQTAFVNTSSDNSSATVRFPNNSVAVVDLILADYVVGCALERRRTEVKLPPAIRFLSRGLLGMARIFVGSRHGAGYSHVVRDAKPEDTNQLAHTLRLRAPLAGIRAYLDAYGGFGNADDAVHAHIPWLLILLQARRNFGEGRVLLYFQRL